jgi:hypothetical protein
MKFRNYFVSNSSSSSFVIALPHIPQSAKDMQVILFGDLKKRIMAGYSFNHDWREAKEVAKIFFDKIKNLTPNDTTNFRGSCEGKPRYENFKLPDNTFDSERYKEAQKEFFDRIVDEFHKEYPETVLYCLSFADDDGESFEEHSVWDYIDIPYLAASNH